MIEYKDQKYWDSQLIQACCFRNLDGVKTALLHGANVNAKDLNGWTALGQAACGNAVAIIKLLLQFPDIDVNVKTEFGDPILLCIAQCGNDEILESILKFPNIDVNAKGNRNWTALMKAARYGQGRCLLLLIKHPDIDLNARDSYGYTALDLAKKNYHVAISSWLEEEGAV